MFATRIAIVALGLSIAASVQAAPILTITPDPVVRGGTVTVLVGGTAFASFEAVTFEVSYAASVFQPLGSLSVGTLTTDFVFDLSTSPGSILVSGFALAEASGDGSLFSLSFTVDPSAATGPSTFVVQTVPDAVGVPGEAQFFATASVGIEAAALAVPEPASLALLASGLLAARLRRRP